MRLAARSGSALVRIVAGAALLALAACSSGEASPNPQPRGQAQLKLMRGYHCATATIGGRYTCARALDRDAQSEAAAMAPRTCPSCGTVSSN